MLLRCSGDAVARRCILFYRHALTRMRVLITIVTALSVSVLFALDNPTVFREVTHSISERTDRIWSNKDVRIEGLHLLSRGEIERLLPLDRSVAWWHANLSEIEAKLAQNAWVAEATITSCPDSLVSRWGCFVVSIDERQPMFLATLNGDSWVVDREGTFLALVSELRNRAFSGRLVNLKGVAVNSNSPDLVRAQLSVASKLCETLEREVSKPVVELEFLGQGDFAVAFQGVSFPIVFAAGLDAKVPLPEQGARCAALLKQLATRFSEVARIDLAFDRVGVVQFKPAPSIEKDIAAG